MLLSTSRSFLSLTILSLCSLVAMPLVAQPNKTNDALISQPTSLSVPGPLPTAPIAMLIGCAEAGVEQLDTIQDALACIRTLPIMGEGQVTIEMTHSPSQAYDPIVIDHANGDRIRIVGNCDGPCEITFKADGLVVNPGHQLAELTDFNLIGNHTAVGLTLINQALVNKAYRVSISHFSNGIYLDYNATLMGKDMDISDNHWIGVRINTQSSAFFDGHNLIKDNPSMDIHLDLLSVMRCPNCTYSKLGTYDGSMFIDH